jgi:hypothetical protein
VLGRNEVNKDSTRVNGRYDSMPCGNLLAAFELDADRSPSVHQNATHRGVASDRPAMVFKTPAQGLD